MHTRRLLGFAFVGVTVTASCFAATAISAPEPACRDLSSSGLGSLPIVVPDGATINLDRFVDVRAAMGMERLPAGGDGSGVTVADIEFDWDASHEDLVGRGLPRPSQGRLDGDQDISHGTAVLSLIGGDADGSGVTGLVPAATLRPISPITATGYRPEQAIALATEALRAGDVMLLELQSSEFGPVEIDVFYGLGVKAAIAAAVAKGIVVVEPAGNAGMPLAGLATADSPALIVGAGTSAGAGRSGDAGRATLSTSTTGARIDVQGPGEAVVTATSAPSYFDFLQGGSGSGSRSYTHCFGGSSSAAAAVAGAVASMQGIAWARRRAPFTPAEVRQRLVATGLAQTDPQNGNIGPLPQVRAAADLDPPPSPTALRAETQGPISPGAVALRWNSSPTDVPAGAGRAADEILLDGAVVGSVEAGIGTAQIAIPDGLHRVVVRSLDRVGNASSATLDLIIDAEAPAAPRDLAPAARATVAAGPVTLRWTSALTDPPANGAGRGADVVSLDGQELGRVAAGVERFETVVNTGTHTWTVRSLDASGNASEASATFIAVNPNSLRSGPSAAADPPGRRVAAGRLGAARRRGGAWVVPVRVRPVAGARVTRNGATVKLVKGRAEINLVPGSSVRVRVTAPGLRTVTYRLRVTDAGRLVIRPL